MTILILHTVTRETETYMCVHFVIVGFVISASACILERVFSHLEGMCSDCK